MSKGWIWAGVIGFALLLAVPAGAVRTGRWSAPRNIGGTAINLMLMPGPDTTLVNNSRIIWWEDDHNFEETGRTNVGGRFLWTPFTDLAQSDTSFQSNHLVPLALGSVGYNIFCSGANFMADSRLAVFGGTTEAENGERRGAIYDAVANTWDTLATRMKWGRWYADVLTLPSGKLLVTSGSQFRHNWLVGGSSSDDSVHRSPVTHGEP